MDKKDWRGNGNAIFRTLGASNHTEKERQCDDYYATDPIAIDKLLEVEKPNHKIWECACGGGHLSERLIEHGYDVFSSDIKDRGYIHFDAEVDFLKQDGAVLPDGCDIITNPPYSYAMEFVLKALEMLKDGCRCYMFLKLTFLEGQKRYNKIFSISPPIKVYVFISRIKCAMDGDFDKYQSSAVAYGWFVWEKGYTGITEVRWI